MKRVLIFVGLKIAEIAGVGLCGVVCCGIGHIVLKYIKILRLYNSSGAMGQIIYPAMIGLIMILLIGMYSRIFVNMIKSNWRKAGELEKKWK